MAKSGFWLSASAGIEPACSGCARRRGLRTSSASWKVKDPANPLNQWGRGGFTTRDLLRCQVAARNAALICNWWNLFVRLAEPERPREAITSRPGLLCTMGQIKTLAGQTVLRLTNSHAEAARV